MTTVFPDPSDVEADLKNALIDVRRAVRALGSAAAAVQLPVSPQMAAGVQATENAWREMEQEFGLLTGAEAARKAGSTARNLAGFANDRRTAGKLLGIRRRNAFVYPGFQFDQRGHVYPVVPRLIAEASRLGVDNESLAQWFCINTASLDGARPVDRAGDEELLVRAFTSRFGVEW